MLSSSPERQIADALDPVGILTANGVTPLPWQRDALADWSRDTIVCAGRHCGKTSTAAALVLHCARWFADQPIPVIAGRSVRQAGELYRKARLMLENVPSMPRLVSDTSDVMEFENGARILALPAEPSNVRGISNASCVVIDECAFVEHDDLLQAVEPMLSVSGGPLWLLSSPNGMRGMFWSEWMRSDDSWRRIRVTWKDAAHLSAEFIERRRRRWPSWKFAQEFEAQFTANELSALDVEALQRAVSPEVSALWT